MNYDVIVIGAGLSGLTAGSLLSKRGLKVAVVDKSYNPGGSCGTFKRDDVIFDQGSAMLFGFGEKGFNSHRFVMNCLEEPIDVIKHDLLYCVNYDGKRIKFWSDTDKFAEELGQVFVSEKDNIKRFYKDLNLMYQHVMVESPTFSTPDEVDGKSSLKDLMKHPLSYAKFLSFMNKSTKDLLKNYFSDPEIFKFFDKLTSTYCYTTVEETPAVLAAVMFVDNHVGGSFYPAGSTVFLPGKLEKVIEENGGEMFLSEEVTKILFENEKPVGVLLKSGCSIFSDNIVYSGSVWNLYGELLDEQNISKEKMEWVKNLIPTYPSVVLYAHVDKKAIPDDTLPIEMLVGNPDKLDESEVTAYIFSIDDHTLCPEDSQVIMAIGPSFEKWDYSNKSEYKEKKEKERIRLIDVLEKRFPSIKDSIKHSEVATPETIYRYTNKRAVAGPKQMLGQHMFNRMHTKSEWSSLYFCGESTVMGTGTPTVTVSGLAAANAILKKLGMQTYVYKENMKNYVNIVPHPFVRENLYSSYAIEEKEIMLKASKCQYCEHPTCTKVDKLDVRGIMRRTTVGNFHGSKKIVMDYVKNNENAIEMLQKYEDKCIQNIKYNKPVEIKIILEYLIGYGD